MVIPMAIEKQIVLRYRSEGHLRFQLPEALCEPELAHGLAASLRAMEGIYRVDLDAAQRKLSIRFLATVCDFAAVIRRLRDSVVQLGQGLGASRSRPCDDTSAGSSPFWIRSVQGRIQELRETFLALRILGQRALAGVNQGMQRRPRWVTEMMNDLLMLYLVKLHWHHILNEWLPRPWTHRYEWVATLYLVYLSVQARLPKPA